MAMFFIDEVPTNYYQFIMFLAPYTQSEIDRFSLESLTFADDFSMAVRKRLREEFAHAVFRLPRGNRR